MPASVWDGSAWRDGTLYVWDGSAWHEVIAGWTWDGNSWRVWERENVEKVVDESLAPSESLLTAGEDAYQISDIASLSETHSRTEEERDVAKSVLDESLSPSDALSCADEQAIFSIADAAGLSEEHARTEEDRDVAQPPIDESMAPADSVSRYDEEAATVADIAALSEAHSRTEEDRDVTKETLDESLTPGENLSSSDDDFTPGTPVLSVVGHAVTSISLEWTDVADETSYELQHYSSGASENPPGPGDWNAEAAPVQNDTDYVDSGLGEATWHYYRIRAVNSGVPGPWSNTVSQQTNTATPAAPTGADFSTATPDDGDDSTWSNELGWTDNAGNESGVRIERSVNGGAYTFVADTAANSESHSDGSVVQSTSYRYRIRAYRTVNGQTASSAWAYSPTHSTPAEIDPPDGVPSGLAATASYDVKEVSLSWTDNSTNEDGFRIERKLASQGSAYWVEIDTVGAGVTAYDDTSVGLAANTSYNYRVRAYNSDGNSAYSNTATVTTPSAPSAPNDLNTTWDSLRCRVAMTWSDVSNNTGYRVYRGATQVATPSADATNAYDSGAAASTSYTYYIEAFNAWGTSGQDSDSITTGTCDGFG